MHCISCNTKKYNAKFSTSSKLKEVCLESKKILAYKY